MVIFLKGYAKNIFVIQGLFLFIFKKSVWKHYHHYYCHYYSVKISEISCLLAKKLQLFEAQSLHITDSTEDVEADKPNIEVDEEDEDLDGLDEVEVEDQAESGSLYTSQTETETETETEDENGEKPKGLEYNWREAFCGYYHY